MVARRYNIGNRSWQSLYQVITSSFLMSTCEVDVLHKTLNYDSTISLRIFPPLGAVLGYLNILFIEIKATIHYSHSRWCCVGFSRQLCRHNIIIKLRHHCIDGGNQQSILHEFF